MSHTINIADATLWGELLMLRLTGKPAREDTHEPACRKAEKASC